MRITREELLKDAASLKIDLTENEIEKLLKDVNTFYDKHPEGIDLTDVEMMRYVNKEVVNVFASSEEEHIDVESLLVNVKDRKGNYVKVPKVLD